MKKKIIASGLLAALSSAATSKGTEFDRLGSKWTFRNRRSQSERSLSEGRAKVLPMAVHFHSMKPPSLTDPNYALRSVLF